MAHLLSIQHYLEEFSIAERFQFFYIFSKELPELGNNAFEASVRDHRINFPKDLTMVDGIQISQAELTKMIINRILESKENKEE